MSRLHPCPERLVDDVEFDGQVLLDELVGVLPVGEDAADPGRGDDHDLGRFLGEERPGLGLIGEIEFLELAGDHVLVAAGAQTAQDRPSHQAGVAGQVDAGMRVDRVPFRTIAVLAIDTMVQPRRGRRRF